MTRLFSESFPLLLWQDERIHGKKDRSRYGLDGWHQLLQRTGDRTTRGPRDHRRDLEDHVERWTLAAHDDDRIVPHSVEERCSSLGTNLAHCASLWEASGDTSRISWMTSTSTSIPCASMAAFTRLFLKAALSSTSTCTPRRAMLPSGRCLRTSTRCLPSSDESAGCSRHGAVPFRPGRRTRGDDLSRTLR